MDLGYGNRLAIELEDVWQRPVTAEFLVRRDTVEIRCGSKLVGIADREYMRGWLANPLGVYTFDDMYLCPAGYGVTLAIENMVPAWPLRDYVVAELRAYV